MKHRWKSQADHGALRSTRSLWDRDRPNWLSISLGKPLLSAGLICSFVTARLPAWERSRARRSEDQGRP